MRLGLAFIVAVLAGGALLLQKADWGGEFGSPREAVTGSAAPNETQAEAPDLADSGNDSGTQLSRASARGSLDRQVAASWYQYTDERGSVHFVSSPSEVPPAYRDQMGQIEMSTPIQTVRAPAPRRRARASLRPDADQVWGGEAGAAAGEVIVYTTTWCGACKKAIAHLEDAGVAYVNKDIEADSAAEAEYLEKARGRRGVPLIDVGGQIMQGYSRQRLDQLLARLG